MKLENLVESSKLNVAVINHIAKIIVDTVKGDDFFENNKAAPEEIVDMILEQFDVLREDLQDSILKQVKRELK